MTKDKAEKAAIRARMAKTGERYTTARHYLLDHHLTPESIDELPTDANIEDASVPDDEPAVTLPPRVADPGMSDDAIRRGTGKTWDEWFGLLDAWSGTDHNHTEIARYVYETFGIDGWWAQGVTVGYERARGMRARHETATGFVVNASKTIAAPVERVFTAFVDDTLRDGWIEAGSLRLRTSQPGRSARFDVLLPGGEGTRLEVWLTVKGETKTAAALQHVKLKGQDDLDPWRAYWKERLNRLAAVLKAD